MLGKYKLDTHGGKSKKGEGEQERKREKEEVRMTKAVSRGQRVRDMHPKGESEMKRTSKKKREKR